MDEGRPIAIHPQSIIVETGKCGVQKADFGEGSMLSEK
jgi:hypothetical protein